MRKMAAHPTTSTFPDELIIRHVKQHSCLYDPRESDYKDAERKAAVWREIASNVGLPGESGRVFTKQSPVATRRRSAILATGAPSGCPLRRRPCRGAAKRAERPVRRSRNGRTQRRRGAHALRAPLSPASRKAQKKRTGPSAGRPAKSRLPVPIGANFENSSTRRRAFRPIEFK